MTSTGTGWWGPGRGAPAGRGSRSRSVIVVRFLGMGGRRGSEERDAAGRSGRRLREVVDRDAADRGGRVVLGDPGRDLRGRALAAASAAEAAARDEVVDVPGRHPGLELREGRARIAPGEAADGHHRLAAGELVGRGALRAGGRGRPAVGAFVGLQELYHFGARRAALAHAAAGTSLAGRPLAG